MSKVTQYLVAVAGKEPVTVDTMREVSKLVGRKVTRAMIEAGQIPEILQVIPTDEDGIHIYDPLGNFEDETVPGGTSRSNIDNTKTNTNNNMEGEDMKEDISNINTEDITEEEEARIRAIIEGQGNEEDDTEDDSQEEPTDEASEDDDSEDEVDPEDDNVVCANCGKEIVTEEDLYLQKDNETVLCKECNTKVNGKPSIQELMARMKALNAKKAAEKGTDTGKGKKKGKKIQFTGEYPEVGTFKEKKDLQKFYKQLSDAQIDEWIELEGLTYKKSENEPINRMRKCMAILGLHFPPETKTTKKKSKYADLSTESLLEIAIENDITVPEAKGDARILRMYTIMALKKAGLLE